MDAGFHRVATQCSSICWKRDTLPSPFDTAFFFLSPLLFYFFSRECGQRPQFLLWYPVKAVLELAKRGLSSESWGNIIQLPPCDPRHTTNPVVHSSVAKEKAPSHNVLCAYAHSEACTHIVHHLHLDTEKAKEAQLRRKSICIAFFFFFCPNWRNSSTRL